VISFNFSDRDLTIFFIKTGLSLPIAILCVSIIFFSIAACAAPSSPKVKKLTALNAAKYIQRTGSSCRADKLSKFLHHGVNVNASVKGVRLLSYALLNGAGDCALGLLKNGASVHYETAFGPFLDSALSVAAGADACEPAVIIALIDRNAEPNKITFDTTPLLSAALTKNIACAEELIRAGASLGRPVPPRGLTPLMVAQWEAGSSIYKEPSDRIIMTKLLLSYGADPNVKMRNIPGRTGEAGMTALFFAVGAGETFEPCAKCARLLIAAGASPNLMSQRGQAPLLWGLSPKRVTTLVAVKALISGGANVDLANPKTGETPLMAAAMRGDEGIVSYLLKSGANRCAKDEQGRTAVDYAHKSHHEKVVKLLSENR